MAVPTSSAHAPASWATEALIATGARGDESSRGSLAAGSIMLGAQEEATLVALL
jgi:hypothetical protein